LRPCPIRLRPRTLEAEESVAGRHPARPDASAIADVLRPEALTHAHREILTDRPDAARPGQAHDLNGMAAWLRHGQLERWQHRLVEPGGALTLSTASIDQDGPAWSMEYLGGS